MGLYDIIEKEVINTGETGETSETSPKSLEKWRNKTGIPTETSETSPKSLEKCPLWQAQFICHAFLEGRCSHEPEACKIANGMRRYIEKHFTGGIERRFHDGKAF